jgi:[ribosomal protein S5]-alanine N-acetyltransferase
MVFLRRDAEEGGRRLIGEGVYLRHPDTRDYLPWAAVRQASREFLTPWEPTWPADELTRPSFRDKLRRYAEDIRDGRAYPFFIFRAEDDQLVGGITLSQVRRGAAHAGTIGYWVGEPYQRRGYVIAAVRAVARFCFDDLALHRVEAACQPDNDPSHKLLLQVGFTEEGRARSYLKINGGWRDHILFAMVAGDPIK